MPIGLMASCKNEILAPDELTHYFWGFVRLSSVIARYNWHLNHGIARLILKSAMDFDRAHIPKAIFHPVQLPFPWLLSKTALSPPLLFHPHDSISERQRKNFDLPNLSPKIKYPICLRKSRRINMPKPLSSCFQSQKVVSAWLHSGLPFSTRSTSL